MFVLFSFPGDVWHHERACVLGLKIIGKEGRAGFLADRRMGLIGAVISW